MKNFSTIALGLASILTLPLTSNSWAQTSPKSCKPTAIVIETKGNPNTSPSAGWEQSWATYEVPITETITVGSSVRRNGQRTPTESIQSIAYYAHLGPSVAEGLGFTSQDMYVGFEDKKEGRSKVGYFKLPLPSPKPLYNTVFIINSNTTFRVIESCDERGMGR